MSDQEKGAQYYLDLLSRLDGVKDAVSEDVLGPMPLDEMHNRYAAYLGNITDDPENAESANQAMREARMAMLGNFDDIIATYRQIGSPKGETFGGLRTWVQLRLRDDPEGLLGILTE